MALCSYCREAGDLIPIARTNETVKNLVLSLWEKCEPGCMCQKVWTDTKEEMIREAD